MTVWVISYLEEGALQLRAFRDLWTAIDVAETLKGESLDWDVARDQPKGRRVGKTANAVEVSIDEITVEPSEADVRVQWVQFEAQAEDAATMQFFANGISLGVDKRPPFEQTWERPEGQLVPVDLTVLVTNHDGTTRQGIIATVD